VPEEHILSIFRVEDYPMKVGSNKHASIGLFGVTSQKTIAFIATVAKTSNVDI
jgi:hypothetical protein